MINTVETDLLRVDDKRSLSGVKTYEIAEKQLGTSFSLEKSIGFIEFIKNKPPSITNKDEWITVVPPKPPKDEWITVVPSKPPT